jgi:hypothetical protein
VDGELDELYSAPLDEFVRTRNAIVERLKREGRSADAAAIATLKKPVVSAWMVNRLARTASDTVADLIRAGESLQRIQRGEGGSYEEARRAENAALVDLRRTAAELDPDVTAGTLERMVASLRAGVASEEGRTLIRTGRLTTDLEASGFDAFAGAVFAQPADVPAATPEAPVEAAMKDRRLEKLREAARTARQEADESAERARRARADAEHAERLAATARKAADAAEKRASGAETKAAEAAARLSDAEG